MYINKTKTRAELMEILKKRANKGLIFSCGMNYKIVRKKVIMQSHKRMALNPFQRIFVFSIKEDNEGNSIIEGGFRYRVEISLFMLCLLLLLIYGHIGAIRSIDKLYDKLVVSFFFSMFYLIISGLFFFGKFMYKKQEDEVVDFINDL